MKKGLAFALALAFILAFMPVARTEAASDLSTIKVKLTTNNATSISMSVSGNYFINENAAMFSDGTLTLRAANGTITVSHSSAGQIYQGSRFSLMRVKMDPAAGYVRFNGRTYLGHFNIKLTSSGFIQIVNELPLAHYLYGVVGNEMSDTYPIEALKAQAIAAKCYVFTQILAGANSEYDIGDTSSDQVYKGYSSWASNVIAAVDQTISEILTVNGQILCTYYAASNGGETSLVTYAWPTKMATNAGYSITLDDYDMASTVAKYEKVDIPITSSGTITRALYNLIAAKAYITLGVQMDAIERLSAVSMSNPKYQGVVRDLTSIVIRGDFSATDASGAYKYYENVDLVFNASELLSYGVVTDSSLRTYWGEYTQNGSYYRIYHARWGHGVGMSQSGAHARAAAGHSYKDILSFYYPGASFSTMQVTAPTDPVVPGNPYPYSTPTPMPTQVTPGGVIAYGELTGDLVNFREGPSTSYRSITRLRKGTQLMLYAYENGWYKASTGNLFGYISGSYVKITGYPEPSQPTPTPSPTPLATAVITDDSKNQQYGELIYDGIDFRTGPADTYASLGRFPQGTQILIHSLVANGAWYYASINGVYGYVNTAYVNMLGQLTPQPTIAPPSLSPMPTASINDDGKVQTYGEVLYDGIDFRTGPADTYASQGRLSKGTRLLIHSLVANGAWYYASVNGVYGYVNTTYITILPQTTPQPTIIATPTPTPMPTGIIVDNPTPYAYGEITIDGVNYRTGPAVTYVSQKKLAKGTQLQLYSLVSNGEWYYAGADGMLGYVSALYVKVLGLATPQPSGNPTPTPTSGQTTVEVAKTTRSGVNMRQGPGVSYALLMQLSENTTVYIIVRYGEWCYVITGSQQGYVHSDYLQVTGTATLNPDGTIGTGGGSSTPAPSTNGAGVTTGNVNMRIAPGVTYAKLAVLPKGTKLTLLALENGWYKARTDNGKEGYVSSKYVSVTSPLPQGAIVTPTPNPGTIQVGEIQAMGTGETTGNVNFREQPSATSKKLATLVKGASLTLYSLSNGWYEAEYKGMHGYVSAKYIRVTSQNGGDPTGGGTGGTGDNGGITTGQVTVTLATAKARGRLNIRSAPSTSGSQVLTVIPSGGVFNVLGVTGEWYYVLYNDVVGFAYRSYADLVSSGSTGVVQVPSNVSPYQTSTTAELNIRTGPSTAAAKIKLLPNRSTITVLLVADGWCLIKADGVLGYVSATYVNLK